VCVVPSPPRPATLQHARPPDSTKLPLFPPSAFIQTPSGALWAYEVNRAGTATLNGAPNLYGQAFAIYGVCLIDVMGAVRSPLGLKTRIGARRVPPPPSAASHANTQTPAQQPRLICFTHAPCCRPVSVRSGDGQQRGAQPGAHHLFNSGPALPQVRVGCGGGGGGARG
jgi:hypothetical protein